MDLIKKIHKNSILTLIPVVLLSAFIEWRKLPLSILTGGLIGLVNIRAISWGVNMLLGSKKADIKMIFFSQFRLLILTLVIAALVYMKLVNIFGILAGFTVVFILLVIEGLKHSKKECGSS